MSRLSEHEIIKTFLTDEPPKDFKFKVGDKVSVINSYGVQFDEMKIIGFDTVNNKVHFSGTEAPYWYGFDLHQVVNAY